MPASSGPRKYAWVTKRLREVAAGQRAKKKAGIEIRKEQLKWLRNERNTVENDIASLRASLAKPGTGDLKTKGARENSILLESQEELLNHIDRLIFKYEGRKIQK